MYIIVTQPVDRQRISYFLLPIHTTDISVLISVIFINVVTCSQTVVMMALLSCCKSDTPLTTKNY